MAVRSMREVTESEYRAYLAQRGSVQVGQTEIRLQGPRQPRRLQPTDFRLETTTVWSFPQRGDWATHSPKYRGNWAPQIPRNLILRYTQPGEVVLDQMMGGGTTLVECRLTGRRGIGVDINRDAVMLAHDALNFYQNSLLEPASAVPEVEIRLYQGDARELDLVPAESVDLVATHPPYANIIGYSRTTDHRPEGDLSLVRGIADFVEEMGRVAEEAYRVLRPGRYCAILVGDTRRRAHYVPIAFRVLQAFLEAGFVLKEDVVKAQWHTMTERFWAARTKGRFLLIMHEHLFVLRKLGRGERLREFRESACWWG